MHLLDTPRRSLISGVVIGLVIGLAVGAVAVGLLAMYVMQSVASGKADNGALGGIIQETRNRTIAAESQKTMTSVYGTVTAISADAITIETHLAAEDTTSFTFVLNSQTMFIELAHDDASTKKPLNPRTIVVGEALDITAQEAIGSVTPQNAIKVVRY